MLLEAELGSSGDRGAQVRGGRDLDQPQEQTGNHDKDDDSNNDLDPNDVADGADVELCSHPGEQPAGEGGGTGHDMAELEFILRKQSSHKYLQSKYKLVIKTVYWYWD